MCDYTKILLLGRREVHCKKKSASIPVCVLLLRIFLMLTCRNVILLSLCCDRGCCTYNTGSLACYPKRHANSIPPTNQCVQSIQYLSRFGLPLHSFSSADFLVGLLYRRFYPPQRSSSGNTFTKYNHWNDANKSGLINFYCQFVHLLNAFSAGMLHAVTVHSIHS